MDKRVSQFIGLIIIVVVFVGGLGMYVSHVNNAPSKYDGLAKALTDSGAKFYGAFWCPHCQATKALFGNAKKFLPYVECSNPDRSPIQICIDEKIEGYPTWSFKDGITLTSKVDPTVCKVAPEGIPVAGEPTACEQRASRYFKTYAFPGYPFTFRSTLDPVRTGDSWKFAPGASVTGELPLEFLAGEIGFTLPQ
jgi:thiol-disulfide isomerase/thioredoxin